MPLAVSFLSLWIGVILLMAVNLELLMRTIVSMLGGGDRLRSLLDELPVGAD